MVLAQYFVVQNGGEVILCGTLWYWNSTLLYKTMLSWYFVVQGGTGVILGGTK